MLNIVISNILIIKYWQLIIQWLHNNGFYLLTIVYMLIATLHKQVLSSVVFT
jgi:hypothetical protein